MGLDDGTSQHSGRGSYIHGSSGSPPPYLSSHSPNPMGPGHPYNSYSENIVYTPMIGEWKPPTYAQRIQRLNKFILSGPPGGTLLASHANRSANSDMSNESSPAHNYPDFPPSPDSWIGGSAGGAAGETGNSTSATNNNSTSAVHY